MEKKFKILVIDDDERIRELLQQFLNKNGFITSIASSTFEAREKMQNTQFDLLVLDLMMPNESGNDFLKRIRKDQKKYIPTIMLTAMSDIENKIECFENGCDDYLVKPFEPKELILRINNILKIKDIKNSKNKQICIFGDFVFDFKKQSLFKFDEQIYLTSIETKLLDLFCKNINKTLEREELLFDGLNERSIDVSIARLRKKIEKDSKKPEYLKTIRYKGYRLNN